MLRVSTLDAVSGMALALPVFHPQLPGHVLLKPDAKLNSGSIQKLNELGVRELFIRYPGLESLLDFTSPRIEQQREVVTGLLSKGFGRLADDVHARLDYRTYRNAVRSLIDRIADEPRAALLIGDVAHAGSEMLSSANTVCFLSLLMGLKLDGYLIQQRSRIPAHRAKQLESLGIGALLHDIGMLALPEETRERWEESGDDSDPDYRSHTRLGFQLVRGNIAPTAAAIVLHHHQRYDGTGFPMLRRASGARPLMGEEIHIFARIAAVAAEFDRMKRATVDDLRRTPTVHVLRRLVEASRDGRIDPMVCKALLAAVPAYPPGSFVTLNTGQMCAVVDWTPTAPCRPTVQAIGGLPTADDPDASPAPAGAPIDLTLRQDLQIVRADGAEVARDNFSERSPGEFDIRVPAEPVGEGIDGSATRLSA